VGQARLRGPCGRAHPRYDDDDDDDDEGDDEDEDDDGDDDGDDDDDDNDRLIDDSQAPRFHIQQ
jgi:hypothetical protein